jgi:predicted amidohydrolase
LESYKIAVVAHESPIRSTAKNLDTTISWVRKAEKAGASLVALPELGVTGHAGHSAMVEVAEPVPDGPSVQALIEVAKELDIYISAGIAEDDRGIHYNTQFIVGPDGYLGKQRKVHLSADEYFYFRGGTALPVIDLPFARVGIIICYDNTFPEMARCLAVDGAELILAPHAARFGKWPAELADRQKSVQRVKAQWSRVHACRAYDNGCYVAVCNTAGRSATGLKGVEANHGGCCMIFDPNGDTVAQSRTRDIKPEMILADLDGDRVAARRRQSCFNLQTRKPEVFSALTRPTE